MRFTNILPTRFPSSISYCTTYLRKQQEMTTTTKMSFCIRDEFLFLFWNYIHHKISNQYMNISLAISCRNDPTLIWIYIYKFPLKQKCCKILSLMLNALYKPSAWANHKTLRINVFFLRFLILLPKRNNSKLRKKYVKIDEKR